MIAGCEMSTKGIWHLFDGWSDCHLTVV